MCLRGAIFPLFFLKTTIYLENPKLTLRFSRILDTRDAYYWATHGGAELDLLVLSGGKRYGFEIKYADAPGTSRSMQVALNDLALEHLWVIYPGQHEYALTDRITALPLDALPSLKSRLL